MSQKHDSKTVEDAYSYCAWLTRKTLNARVNVTLIIPKEVRKYAAVLWLLAKKTDDIADNISLTISSRHEQLSAIESQVYECYDGMPTEPLYIALQDMIVRFCIPRELFEKIFVGCKNDLTMSRIMDSEELYRYCETVNSQGRIAALILNYRDEEFLKLCDNLTTCFQLIDILIDLPNDLELNRLYLPEDEILKFGCTEEMIFEKKMNSRIKSLLKYQSERIERHLYNTKPFLYRLKFKEKLNYKAIYFTYRKFLENLIKIDFNVFDKKLKISIFDLLSVVFNVIFKRID